MLLDAAHRTLAACALAGPGEAVHALESPEALDRLLHSAPAHQLRPQVAARAGAPEGEARQALDAAAGAHRGRGLFLAAELRTLLAAVRAQGLPVVAFKGPAFAELVGEGAGMREMGDLDLLVEQHHVPRLVSVLAGLGFRPAVPPAALRSPYLWGATSELKIARAADGLLLEAHWRLAPPWFPAPVTVAQVQSCALERMFLGTPILWPAAEELFLAHVADAMKSCGCRLRWVGDLRALLRAHPSLDWGRVARLAAGNRALDSVRVALAVLGDVCEAAGTEGAIPDGALALAGEARARPRLREATREVMQRLADDVTALGAAAHFRWTLRTADRPLPAAFGIARYLCAPALPEMAGLETEARGAMRLHWRAMRRRVSRLTSSAR